MFVFIVIGGHLLVNAGQSSDVEEGRKRIIDSLENGTALEKFGAMLTAQGVSSNTVAELIRSREDAATVLPKSRFTRHLICEKTGTCIAAECVCGEADVGEERLIRTPKV